MPEIGVNIDVLPKHKCNFNLEIIDNEFLISEASCSSKAKYYYSCSCGLHGTESFECGNKTEHVFDCMVTDDKYLASESTCCSQAKYYYSCSCGLRGSKTFEFGSLENHEYSHDLSCVEDVCLECGNIKTSVSHNWGSGVIETEPTSNTTGKRVYTCADCGAKMTEVIPQVITKGCSGSVTLSISSVILLFASLVVIRFKKKRFNLD